MTSLTLVESPAMVCEQEAFESQECEEPEQQSKKQRRETPNILYMFMAHIRYFTNGAKSRLQIEESGNRIAELQGNCLGHIAVITAILSAGYDDFSLIMDTEEPIFRYQKEDSYEFFALKEGLSLPDLFSFYLDVNKLLASEGWKSVQTDLNNRIQEKKDWLYAQADKGRDMHFVHGWDFTIRLIDNWANCIKDEYLSAKRQQEKALEKKKEELPFDDD